MHEWLSYLIKVVIREINQGKWDVVHLHSISQAVCEQ